MKRTTNVVEKKEENAPDEEIQNIVNVLPDPDAPIRWKKIGGGSFRLGRNRIIKPNEKFIARPSQIPKNFRDIIIPLDEIVEISKVETIIKGKKPIYSSQPSEKREIKPRGKSRSLFDVFDLEGNMINEEALRKEDAEKLRGFDIINPDGKVVNEIPLEEDKIEELLKNLNA